VVITTKSTWDNKQGTTKICTRCHKEKSVKDDEFYTNQNGRPASQCKQCIRERFDAWVVEHPEENKESRRRAQLTPNSRARKREYEYKLRISVLDKLGNKCAKCDWVDPRALHVDHVYGNGQQDRGHGSTAFVKKVLADTKGNYQLLCANHNAIKKYECLEGVSKHHPLAGNHLSNS
jgi:hypothetical protein